MMESAPRDPRGGGNELGARLRIARKSAGLTLKEVAAPSGISIAYLSDLERGVLSNPTLDKIAAIASSLGVSVDSLIGQVRSEESLESEALSEFLRSSEFLAAVSQSAAEIGVSPEFLARQWSRALGGIQINGRTPQRSLDYLLIFEAVRRSLGE